MAELWEETRKEVGKNGSMWHTLLTYWKLWIPSSEYNKLFSFREIRAQLAGYPAVDGDTGKSV